MRLSLRIILLVITIVILMVVSGAFLAIQSARHSVEQETESIAQHTLQLITATMISSSGPGAMDSQRALIEHLQKMDRTRHLRISVVRPNGQIIRPEYFDRKPEIKVAPDWFYQLIAPAPREYRRKIGAPGSSPVEIILFPSPEDEIRDVWQNTRTILFLILSFTLITILLVTWVIRYSLRPINDISRGLAVIQSGDYQARLPTFNLPELNQLSTHFNHMATVLERQQKENRRLSKRALEIAENERRHLARELHDELGQSISAIKAVAMSQIQKNSEQDNQSSQSIINISDHIYGTVRGMMHRLRPAVLDELGLVAAVEQLVDDWNGHHENTFCALRIRGDLHRLDENLNIQIYRIIQESLTNVVKHANASEVKINLEQSPTGELLLFIKDDGQGYDPSIITQGLGLPGLRDRVNSINGNLSLETGIGKGVTITISRAPTPAEIPTDQAQPPLTAQPGQ